MKRQILTVCVLVILTFTTCRNTGKQTSSITETNVEQAATSVLKITPVYAKGFQVTYTGNVCLVDIQDPQQEESQSFRYALVPRGTKTGNLPDAYTVIETPVRSLVCMTSLQLSNFIKLGELDRVAGITSTRHLFNKEMNQRLKEGKTRKIGIEGNFDNEVIMSMNPDLILISPFKRGGYDALKEVGIPLIPHLGYKEMTPLGQAEWLKFVGLLIGQEEKANEQFAAPQLTAEHDRAFLDLCRQLLQFVIAFFDGGNWYAVGGKSFLAQLFQDAGADYFLKDDARSGGVTLDFETVYSQAAHADYWRIVNSYHGTFSYDVLKDEDVRYADFSAFKNKGVIYCNMSDKPFYENMPVEPEIMLADLIQAFHPQLLPEHGAKYYDLLK